MVDIPVFTFRGQECKTG